MAFLMGLDNTWLLISSILLSLFFEGRKVEVAGAVDGLIVRAFRGVFGFKSALLEVRPVRLEFGFLIDCIQGVLEKNLLIRLAKKGNVGGVVLVILLEGLLEIEEEERLDVCIKGGRLVTSLLTGLAEEGGVEALCAPNPENFELSRFNNLACAMLVVVLTICGVEDGAELRAGGVNELSPSKRNEGPLNGKFI